jgi:hypothetical protein
VAKLVDAPDSKSGSSDRVPVQVRLPVPLPAIFLAIVTSLTQAQERKQALKKNPVQTPGKEHFLEKERFLEQQHLTVQQLNQLIHCIPPVALVFF